MKTTVKYICSISLLILSLIAFSSFFTENNAAKAVRFPYKTSGLTEREAAAHLLSRFTYGATPGEVDEVVKSGLENWFNKQLEATIPDDSLNSLLSKFDALKLSNAQIVSEYPKGNQVLRMAIKDGVVDKDSVNKNRNAYRQVLQTYMQQNGMKPEQELYRDFINQKILRSAYTNNQLQEVMTDFWFNHFNVSITKGDCAQFIPDYERDVIRPNALGKFNDMLLATAKSPAMLYYLDNFSSSAANDDYMAGRGLMRRRIMQNTAPDSAQVNKFRKARKTQGINENYAREVMELHTLGVDGGYTQQDVTQAAKVLTGWTIYPLGQYNKGVKIAADKVSDDRFAKAGFVHDGDFLFNANRHDNSQKTVLGHQFGPDGGYQEGVDLLRMLAHNPATAKFISKKLAVRFVSDNPPQSLLNKMSNTFLTKDGDIKQVLITMVSSPEFWSANAVREKTKSPFELAIGAVRTLHAEITQPYQLYTWINRMGEKIYYYQAPTGFPDKGQYWINTGALLNRMNFGLALASGRIPGVKIDLTAINNHHEPESAQAALITYCKLIMPERKLDETIKRLTPLLTDPTLMEKVKEASANTPAPQPKKTPVMDSMTAAAGDEMIGGKKADEQDKPKNNYMAMQNTGGNNSMLSQVVGVIIGSPEYQRR